MGEEWKKAMENQVKSLNITAKSPENNGEFSCKLREPEPF